MNKCYRVSGSKYFPSGWETNSFDCYGFSFFKSLEEAQECAEAWEKNSGYGLDCFIEAEKSVIEEVSLDDPFIADIVRSHGYSDESWFEE